MEKYFETNKKRWNELVKVHTEGGGYDVEEFLMGTNTLTRVELEAL